MKLTNWSENQHWQAELLQPASEEEIIDIIKTAHASNKKIRVYGSTHSFTALNNTHGISLNLDNYQGYVSHDTEKMRATVKAGTKLHELGKILFSVGMAMENMGDVDRQSIAGALNTGTHGTGINFGTLSTQIHSIRLINGKGEVVECSENENSELFKCAQISLGSLGIITELTLKCVPAYKLKLEKKRERLQDVLDKLDEYNSNNRNFEFYWLPYTEWVQTKFTNVSEGQTDKDNFFTYLNDVVLENYAFKLFCEFARIFPSKNAFISSMSAKFISGSVKIKQSHEVYATPRLVKFNEMEYNIPAEKFKEVLLEIVDEINTGKYAIHFPLECRFVREDDINLSPANGRKSAYIACHVYQPKEYKTYFTALEKIFIKHGGRPHWGKLHTQTHDFFSKVYPAFETFNRIRQEQDPKGMFLNDHLQEIFG